jgi:putative RNA 2'-phosphotransferase
MNRNHVHLSKDEQTAINVGKRKSSNITILKIDTEQYLTDGYKIYISKNEVYLVDNVPTKYISK